MQISSLIADVQVKNKELMNAQIEYKNLGMVWYGMVWYV